MYKTLMNSKPHHCPWCWCDDRPSLRVGI